MNKNLRNVIIAGNWKMNKTPSETKALIAEIAPLAADAGCEVVVCPPTACLAAACEAAKGTNIKIGAQNVHFEKNGAYTGETSADMLLDLGVSYAIIGHSERRQYFGETDATVNLRTKAAIEAGLTAIVCVGETLGERELGITAETVSRQTKVALSGIEDLGKIVIAYEPVWAIGTGKTATDEQAEEVCALIRDVLASLYGKEKADKTVIQYGGSMNAGNAASLLGKENIDGGLIGGASLKAADFGVIIAAAK